MALPQDPLLGYKLAKQGVNLTKKDPISLRYPYTKLTDRDDYLKIEIIQYKAPGLETSGGANSFALRTSEESLSDSKKNPIATIILPIPQGVGDTNSVSWGEESMSAPAGALTGEANKFIQSSGMGQLLQSGSNLVNKIQAAATDGSGQKAFSAGFAGAAVNALLGQGSTNINSLIARATGGIINQNVELLFNAVTIRPEFSFSFDLVPRFKKESDEVKQIIRIFKQAMAAKRGNTTETGGGFFVKSPDVFNVQYMSGGKVHPFLNRFKPMALTSMSVNYTGSGQYATYSDATPVHMQLTLAFKELTPIYAEDYTDSVPGVGY